jgi:hypothetical protein
VSSAGSLEPPFVVAAITVWRPTVLGTTGVPVVRRCERSDGPRIVEARRQMAQGVVAGLCNWAKSPTTSCFSRDRAAEQPGLLAMAATSAARRGLRRKRQRPSSQPGLAGSALPTLIPGLPAAPLSSLPSPLRSQPPPSMPTSSGSSTTRSPARRKAARSVTGYATLPISYLSSSLYLPYRQCPKHPQMNSKDKYQSLFCNLSSMQIVSLPRN